MSVANFDFMSIPDFLAGFLFVITTEDHLTEISGCYEGGDYLYQEVEVALSDLSKPGKDWEIQGIIQFGLVGLQIPMALHGCIRIGDDVAAIEKWISIFIHPKELTTTLVKALALHRKEIRTEFATTKADFDGKLWYQAGIDTAELMQLVLGPIVPISPWATALLQ